MQNNKKYIYYLLPILGLFIIGIFLLANSEQKISTFLLKAKSVQENYLNNEVNDFSTLIQNNKQKISEISDWKSANNIFKSVPNYNTIYVYKNDSLVFWNNNQCPEIKSVLQQDSLLRLQNGYYLTIDNTISNTKIRYFICLKKKYFVNNDFLKSEFIPSFNGMDFLKVVESNDIGVPVFSKSGNVIYKIQMAINSKTVNLYEVKLLAGKIFFIGFVLFIFWLPFFMPFSRFHIKSDSNVLGFIGLVFGVRILFFLLKDFLGVSLIELFDPKIFANSFWIPSLGDLLLHVFCISSLILYVVFNKQTFIDKISSVSLFKNRVGYLYFIFFIFYFLVFHFSWIISSNLILNSNIPINISILFDLGFNSYIALFILVFIVLINSYILLSFNKIIKRKKISILNLILSIVCIFIICLILWFGDYYEYFGIFLLAFFSLFLLLFRQNVQYRLLLFYQIFIVCIVFGLSVSNAIHKKLIDNAKLVSQKVYAPNDPLALFLLNESFGKLHFDPFINRLFHSTLNTDQSIINRIKLQYLRGYLDRFLVLKVNRKFYYDPIGVNDIQLTDSVLSISQPQILSNFVEPIRFDGRQAYELNIPFFNANNFPDTLSLILVQKTIKAESPFPNLFTEGDWLRNIQYQVYNWAYYQKGKLALQSGRYPYNLVDAVWDKNGFEFHIQEKDDFEHLLYEPEKDALVIISYPKPGIVNFLTIVSMLIFISIFLVFILWLGWSIAKNGLQFLGVSYKNRIEFVLISSIAAVLVLLGYITVTYSVYKNKTRQQDLLTRKIQNISTYVDLTFKESQFVDRLSDEQISALNLLSGNNYTDIFIFDKKGRLAYASQAKLFDQGIVSDLISYDAFFQMNILQRTLFVTEEKIGKLKYLSAYLPLKDASNSLVAVLNVPSFSTEQDLRQDLNTFLGTLLNIYVIVLIIVIFIAFWISDRITKPLKLLTYLISQTKLGNQKLAVPWKRKDEIGVMLLEYEQMVLQLEEKASLLAQSERESAWREMARQVAHEIRNPLTPIKLNIQYLMRAWSDKSPKFDELLNRTSSTILEQIESLNRIAVEFSTFAQMPISEKHNFNFIITLIEVIDLFESSVEIQWINESEIEKAIVYADEEQIKRALNNLIKNAVQSVDSSKKAKVILSITEEAAFYKVEIRDNGNGISTELFDKIFKPNFTTKSSGMGLGLAIVKKIIETNLGTITFISELGVGTSFFIKLPISKIE